MSLVDTIQIIIGILTLVATVAVSFTIYWLQLCHEKEMQKMAANQVHKELEEKAKLFLIDNEAERDYLPWCIIAASVCRLDKHTREIYNSFCRCPEELRNEILKQAGFEIRSIKEQIWVNDCIEAIVLKHWKKIFKNIILVEIIYMMEQNIFIGVMNATET